MRDLIMLREVRAVWDTAEYLADRIPETYQQIHQEAEQVMAEASNILVEDGNTRAETKMGVQDLVRSLRRLQKLLAVTFGAKDTPITVKKPLSRPIVSLLGNIEWLANW